MLFAYANIPDVHRQLDAVRLKQVPFALSLGINLLAKEAARAQTAQIMRAFAVKRKGFLKTSTRVTRLAQKRDPAAVISVRDKFLVQHEAGDTRRPGDVHSSIVNPVSKAAKRKRILRGTNTPRGLMAANKRVFIARTKYHDIAILRRRGKRARPLETVFVLERQVKLKPRLGFAETVNRTTARHWNRLFGQALARAIATQR